MKSIIVLFTIIFTIALLSPLPSGADGKSCIPVFGGGQTCSQPDNIEIDKLIQNPSDKTFLDNLDPNTQNIPTGSTVNFHIIVTNKKTTKINNIKITDTLPQSLTFIKASNNGQEDVAKHTVTYEIDLEGGKSQELTLSLKAASTITTPKSCLANQVTAEAQSKLAADNTQFCISSQSGFPTTSAKTEPQAPQIASIQPQPGSITKGGKTLYPTPTGATLNPNTGPEALALFALIPTGISGLILRRRAK